MAAPEAEFDFLSWQKDVWDAMSRAYEEEVEPRLAPVVAGVVRRAAPAAGAIALDLGCGPGSVAMKLAAAGARVHAVDISDQMLRITEARAERADFDIQVEYGRAEHIPALDQGYDIVTASLSLMFVADKAAAASEIARVLKPGGRFVASAWGPPDRCDIVRFQRILGAFAPEPPVKGVGPGSLADPTLFNALLARAGIAVRVEPEIVTWTHPSLEHALSTFTHVTASRMTTEQQAAARAELIKQMWPEPDQPRTFHNTALFLIGERA